LRTIEARLAARRWRWLCFSAEVLVPRVRSWVGCRGNETWEKRAGDRPHCRDHGSG